MVELRVFGVPTLQIDGQDYKLHSTKTLLLLAYLAIEPRRQQNRTKLATLLWGQATEKRALHSLRQALYSIRQALTEEWLDVTSTTVTFQPGDTWWSDNAAFDAALAQSPPAYAEAINVYIGDFLEGIDVPESEEFVRWLRQTRTRYQTQFRTALYALAEQHLLNGAIEQTIALSERLIHEDPFEEGAYRLAMRAYHAKGDKVMMQQAYERCITLLQEELGADPALETRRLYQTLLTPSKQYNSADMRTTPFIGRYEEFAQLNALSRSGHRLITIIGMGGIGKTFLVTTYAQQQSARYPDGLFFISLHETMDLSGALHMIASTVGIDIVNPSTLRDRVIDYFEMRDALLILDNAEHIDGLPRLVQDLLDKTRISLIVTSRNALGVGGEQQFPLNGLSTDETSDQLSPAGQLFVEFASRANPDFTFSLATRQVIQAIVTLLGGSPLAIRLAAGWSHVLSVDDIFDTINDSLLLLKSDQTDLPERHRSVYAAFHYSWALLDPQLQNTLMALVEFRTPFSLQAIKAVTGIGPLRLATLVQLSWLDFRQGDDRYMLHPLIRLYVRDMREQSEVDFEDIQRSYLDYFAKRLVDYAADYPDHNDSSLITDFDDIRHAWELAIELGSVTALVVMLDPLILLVKDHSRFKEAAPLLVAAKQPLTEAEIYPRLLRHLGFVYRELADFDAAYAYYKACIDAARRSEDTIEGAWSYAGQALLHTRQGHYDLAWEAIRQAEALAAEETHQELQSAIYNHKGLLQFRGGDTDAALITLNDALSLAQASGHINQQATILASIGNTYFKKGQYAAARNYYERSIDLNAKHTTIGNLGMAVFNLGDHERAIQHFTSTLDHVEAQGRRFDAGIFSFNLGCAYQTIGDLSHAIQHLQKSLHIRQKLGDQRGIIRCYSELGLTHAFQSEYEVAHTYLKQAEAISKALNEVTTHITLIRSFAIVYALQGNFLRAIQHGEEARVLYDRHDLNIKSVDITAYICWWHLQTTHLDRAIDTMLSLIDQIMEHDEIDFTAISLVVCAHVFYAAGDEQYGNTLCASVDASMINDSYELMYIIKDLPLDSRLKATPATPSAAYLSDRLLALTDP